MRFEADLCSDLLIGITILAQLKYLLIFLIEFGQELYHINVLNDLVFKRADGIFNLKFIII